MTSQPHMEIDVEIAVRTADELTAAERAGLFEVFDASYRQANHAYLTRSIERIGLIAIALSGGQVVAFAITNARWVDLPGFDEPQFVVFLGMRCVLPAFRHRGLSTRLGRALDEEMRRRALGDGPAPRRQLFCGRHGHASGAAGRDDPRYVPRPGREPTPWQQQVGLAIAEIFGSRLDPATFVCIGSRTPIGYPNEEFEATEAERAAYAAVNRDRGDNLLVLNWVPDPPPGWAVEE